MGLEMQTLSPPGLNLDQLCQFAERGYIVVPDVVPQDLIDAATAEIDRLCAQDPPPEGHQGFHFYWCDDVSPPHALLDPLFETKAPSVAEALTKPHRLKRPKQIQISLNLPPWDHRPGGPHLDGLTPPEPSGRPGTFTMLVGIFLTDQPAEDMGNLWVWPGTHLINADYFAAQGSDQLMASAPYPPTSLPEPEQILGRAGDILLAHYLLGHNMGGNLSPTVRQTLYYRVRVVGHESRWRSCIQDALLEFEPAKRSRNR